MPLLHSGDLGIHYQVVGEGDPLVLVHGSWNDHMSWRPAIDADARASFRVITYDRRGHGRSEAAPGQGTRREDEDDLAAVIEQVAGASAHVAGNSFGASITLGLATRSPGLFRSVTAHEPPLFAIVADDQDAMAELRPTQATIDATLDHLRNGEYEQAAWLFVEEVALGPGMWDRLPAEVRETFVHNAPTWLDEQSDPGWATLDLDGLARCSVPLLLSRGSESPPWTARVLDRLAAAVPQARYQVLEGAGHIPHITHPEQYVDALTRFISRLPAPGGRAEGGSTP
ncbi:alpha/beta fold hydrolase [Streptomyces siamensis]|uniref:Alpha/beta hydrolase n=1 Tax=Streptomyces siamensis TaxID=1274986 RepID=A0ABP9JP50_9ACTN